MIRADWSTILTWAPLTEADRKPCSTYSVLRMTVDDELTQKYIVAVLKRASCGKCLGRDGSAGYFLYNSHIMLREDSAQMVVCTTAFRNQYFFSRLSRMILSQPIETLCRINIRESVIDTL